MATWVKTVVHETCSLFAKTKPATKTSTARWRQPDPGITKVNVDAAYSSDSALATTGLIARGTGGEFKLAAARRYENIPNPLMAETLALRDGVRLAAVEGWDQLEFESDCQVLVMLSGRMTGRKLLDFSVKLKSLANNLPPLSSLTSVERLMYVRISAQKFPLKLTGGCGVLLLQPSFQHVFRLNVTLPLINIRVHVIIKKKKKN